MKKVLLLAAACIALASCATTTGSIEPTGEIQIAGHPWKSAKDCVRKAPVGQFDPECDIPVVGFRGFNGGDVIVPQIGAPGGFNF